MYCTNCGEKLEKDARFCPECGHPVHDDESSHETLVMAAASSVTADAPPLAVQRAAGVTLGFSPRINDPAFKKYIKNANSYAAIFSIAIALIAVVAFYIAGERGVEGMSNPESLYIGFGIGGMFILIALFHIMGRKRSKTWDGKVVKKFSQSIMRKVHSGDDTRREKAVEFNVVIQKDSGKSITLTAINDDTVYNYYEVGDMVRHHGGLNSYEKYDKTKDSIIFCSACATLCDITEDTCHRCKCPLLK